VPSTSAGTVAALHVTEGQPVLPGQTLLTLKTEAVIGHWLHQQRHGRSGAIQAKHMPPVRPELCRFQPPMTIDH